jgi:short-subunit dehydrogenase involved in D-alanine esterification of teichoic acids
MATGTPTLTTAVSLHDPDHSSTTGKSENHELKSSDLFDVSHVTALVTGGATGIGLMITQALVANGARVYITGRREETLKKTVEQYNTGAGSLHSLVGDVSTKEGCMKLAEEMKEKEPKGIQLLVNNAGVARDDATKFCESWLT